MKRKNIDKYLHRLSEITNAKISDLEDTLRVLDGKMYKLVDLVEIMINNGKVAFPTTPKEVMEILKLPNAKTFADFSNFFINKPIYLYRDVDYKRQRYMLKKHGVVILGKTATTEFSPVSAICANKKVRKEYHDYYTGTHPTKPKQSDVKKMLRDKKKKRKVKDKKTSYHYTQSKLVCVMNTKTYEIIRIRKDEVITQTKKRSWENWTYVPKTAYKAQQGKYKIESYYSKTDENGNKINEYPLKNLFSKVIKIDLVKAFFVSKDKQIELDDKTKVIKSNEDVVYKGKDHEKVKYVTKEVANGMMPAEKAGRNKIGTEVIKGKTKKLVEERIYIPGKNGKGKYVTKKVLKEVPTEKIVSKFKPVEKVSKFNKFIKKVKEVIPGKTITYKKPLIVKATKFISSVYMLSKSIYNNKRELRDTIIITKTDRYGNVNKIPKKVNKIIYKYPDNVLPFKN